MKKPIIYFILFLTITGLQSMENNPSLATVKSVNNFYSFSNIDKQVDEKLDAIDDGFIAAFKYASDEIVKIKKEIVLEYISKTQKTKLKKAYQLYVKLSKIMLEYCKKNYDSNRFEAQARLWLSREAIKKNNPFDNIKSMSSSL